MMKIINVSDVIINVILVGVLEKIIVYHVIQLESWMKIKNVHVKTVEQSLLPQNIVIFGLKIIV